MNAWLQLFRIVNLPTVPGDVLVGLAAVLWSPSLVLSPRTVIGAILSSCALYLFGMVDNDIVGAASGDGEERPIPAGKLSLTAARVARGLCLGAALVIASLANLSSLWWIGAFALAVAIVVYNRCKASLVMGVCRGLNVLCGGLAAGSVAVDNRLSSFVLGGVTLFATAYIAAVTRYAAGERAEPVRRAQVGVLLGAIVYLQLVALLIVYLVSSTLVHRNLLVIGAVMLILLRLMKRALPKVSAS